MGIEVAKLRDGNFIGEVSFITEGMATATCAPCSQPVTSPGPRTAIKALLARNPSMRFAMQALLSTDLSKKLMRRAPSFQRQDLILDTIIKADNKA
jgi:hypothetical protein